MEQQRNNDKSKIVPEMEPFSFVGWRRAACGIPIPHIYLSFIPFFPH